MSKSKQKAKKSKSVVVECKVPQESVRVIERLSSVAGITPQQFMSGVLQWAADNGHPCDLGVIGDYSAITHEKQAVWFGRTSVADCAKEVRENRKRSIDDQHELFVLDFSKGAKSDPEKGSLAGSRYAPKAA